MPVPIDPTAALVGCVVVCVAILATYFVVLGSDDEVGGGD